MKKTAFIIMISLLSISCKKDKEDNSTEQIRVDSTTVPQTQEPITSADSLLNKNKINEIDEDYIQKATISKSDSTFWIQANMKLDHRIFGYEKPDVKSKKMILYSIFTDDVEKNPFQCPYGAYYDTTGYHDMILKFQEYTGDFAKVKIITDVTQHTVYFEKKWLEFE